MIASDRGPYIKFIGYILVFLVAAGTALGLYASRPQAKKSKARRLVPLVKTIKVSPRSEQVYVEAFGTVIPAKKMAVLSEVEGRIININPELIPGGLINQDSLVVQIDPTDYALLINESKAEVAEAQYKLELEKGRQVIAKQEWRLLEENIVATQTGKSLALREPHLRSVQAQLEAAKSRLAAAELEEKRTTIRAPFNALVLEEFVEKGQLVGRQTQIATLVETDYFWVQASIPLVRLARITFPEKTGQKGAGVRIILQVNGGPSIIRHGSALKLLGDLDPKGRMARMLIKVNDPLNLAAKAAENVEGKPDKGKILLGSYVKVEIDAGVLDNVYAIPRQALRAGDRIWILNREGRLDIRPVDILWRRKDEILVTAELAPQEKLIVSRLQSPLPGMKVQSEIDTAPAKDQIKNNGTAKRL
jgi:RND family efflux transporter MFP subunit